MLRYFAKYSPAEEFRELSVLPPEGGVWVYADHPTGQELAELAGRFQLDENIVRDLHDREELPRVERSGDAVYVFLRSAGRSKHGEVLTSPLLSIITPKAFITLTAENTLAAEKIMAATGHSAMRTSDGPALVLSTLVAVVVEYEELIQRTNRYIKDIGHRLRTHEVDNSDFIHFVTVEHNLNEFSQNLNEMMVIAERLLGGKYFKISAKDQEALDDVLLHMKQLVTGVKSSGLTLASIREAYSTISNNTLNRRIKTLTVFTVLITLPNVLFGMYGMNIALPLQESPWAYGLIVLFTITLVLVVYAIAKRARVF